jgi:hypothetical protein
MGKNEAYLERLVETLIQQTKARCREQATRLGDEAYSDFFWRFLCGTSAATLGKIVACAHNNDLGKSNGYQGNAPSNGMSLMMRIAHAVLYRHYKNIVFGKDSVD